MQTILFQPIALGRTAEVYGWDGNRVLKLYFERRIGAKLSK
jgi:hypothetical protein